MKALIQRVSEAHVIVDGGVVGAIQTGMLVLLAIEKKDTTATANKIIHKLQHYRIFPDANEKMNCSVKDIDGGILLISQFTLAADTRKGLRPSFSCAAEPSLAQELYDYTVSTLKCSHPKVATGIFAADMKVHLVNDGPVTFLLTA